MKATATKKALAKTLGRAKAHGASAGVKGAKGAEGGGGGGMEWGEWRGWRGWRFGGARFMVGVFLRCVVFGWVRGLDFSAGGGRRVTARMFCGRRTVRAGSLGFWFGTLCVM